MRKVDSEYYLLKENMVCIELVESSTTCGYGSLAIKPTIKKI